MRPWWRARARISSSAADTRGPLPPAGPASEKRPVLANDMLPQLVEVEMPKVAIGLFENPQLARQVRSDLENCGCAPRDIRIVAEPVAMNDSNPGTGTGTPHTDFEVELVRQLTRMGVEQSEAMAYREGVRRGGVLVIATGPDSQVDAAAEAMNREGADRVEKGRGAGALGSAAQHEATAELSFNDDTVQAGRVRYGGGGARVFVW